MVVAPHQHALDGVLPVPEPYENATALHALQPVVPQVKRVSS
jgi:hypothetical protein